MIFFSSDNSELKPGDVEVLVANTTNLMEAIAEFLKSTVLVTINGGKFAS